MHVRHALAALLLATAAPLAAQEQAPSDNTVRPGMTEADVRARWGEPLAVRRANDWTYMFYASGMESVYRYHDVVFLQGGQVVDAIVRAPGRVYQGQSSSPPDRAPERTLPVTRPEAAGATGAVTGVRVNP